MLTPAHIAASYLLTQTTSLVGQPLTPPEVGAVIVAGTFIDIDFVVGLLFGKRGDEHHTFVTHTPIAICIMWVVAFLFLGATIRPAVWLLTLCAGILHLVLDDVGYWFYRWGWQKLAVAPQINWVYPFRPFEKREYNQSHTKLLKDYFTKARINVAVEAILIFVALVVFFLTKR